jgi:hypothetical protein
MTLFIPARRAPRHAGDSGPAPTRGGCLRLRPQFRKLCLDVVNGGPHDGFAHMAECGDYSGQHWKME